MNEILATKSFVSKIVCSCKIPIGEDYLKENFTDLYNEIMNGVRKCVDCSAYTRFVYQRCGCAYCKKCLYTKVNKQKKEAMKCKCDAFMHPIFFLEALGDTWKDAIYNVYPKCKKCDRKPDYINSICGCLACKECIRELFVKIDEANASKPEGKKVTLQSLKCYCDEKPMDFSFLKAFDPEKAMKLMTGCVFPGCSSNGVIINYGLCKCMYCLPCISALLDKHMSATKINYMEMKCPCNRCVISPYCAKLTGPKYAELMLKPANKEAVNKWIADTLASSTVKFKSAGKDGEKGSGEHRSGKDGYPKM